MMYARKRRVVRIATIGVSAVVLAAGGAFVAANAATSSQAGKSTSSKSSKSSKSDKAGKGTKSTASTSPAANGGGSGSSAGQVTGFATVAGGTTGGAGAAAQTVTTAAQLQAAAGAAGKGTVVISGVIKLSADINVASDKTIKGAGKGSGLDGAGLKLKGVHNVIIENLTISKAKGKTGDAIHIEGSNHVYVAHNDLFSDRSHGKDYYDGLLDITHASDYITLSYNRLHDHYKGVLIGHSDNNGAEDKGHLHVTIDHNEFKNLGSRVPSLRFGTGHVYNNVFTDVNISGIHARDGAEILAQNNVMTNVAKPYWSDGGTVLQDPAKAPSWAYNYTLQPTSAVTAAVAQAGPQ